MTDLVAEVPVPNFPNWCHVSGHDSSATDAVMSNSKNTSPCARDLLLRQIFVRRCHQHTVGQHRFEPPVHGSSVGAWYFAPKIFIAANAAVLRPTVSAPRSQHYPPDEKGEHRCCFASRSLARASYRSSS